MASLSGWCDRHSLSKSTVWGLLQEKRQETGDPAYETSKGLSATAEAFLMEHYKVIEQPTVTVVDEPAHSTIQIDGFGGGEMVFNPAAIVGMTNGTAGAIAAIDQMKAVLGAVKQGITAVGEQAKADYLAISAAEREVAQELKDLELTITQVKAESNILDAMKHDRLNAALDTQAAIKKLRGGT